MSTEKKSVRGRILPVLALSAVAALAVLCLQTPSYASAPNPGSRTTTLTTVSDHRWPADHVLQSVLTSDFPVGDCIMNHRLSDVEIDTTSHEFIWDATALTTHTNNADIWHGTFQFRNAANVLRLTVGPYDGARMTVINQPYGWQVIVPLTTVPTDATTVTWIGAC